MKRTILVILALLTMVSTTVVAEGPPVIDGVVSPDEWDGAQAIPMYWAGKVNRGEFATAHRICANDVEYWWIDGGPSWVWGEGHDQFVKMEPDIKRAKMVKVCASPPEEVGNYVDIPGTDGYGAGFECSGPALAGCNSEYNIVIHLSVWYNNAWQSIRTAKGATIQ